MGGKPIGRQKDKPVNILSVGIPHHTEAGHQFRHHGKLPLGHYPVHRHHIPGPQPRIVGVFRQGTSRVMGEIMRISQPDTAFLPRQKAAGIHMDGGFGKGIVLRIELDFMGQAGTRVIQENSRFPPHGNILPRVFQHDAPVGNAAELVDKVRTFQSLDLAGRLPEFGHHLRSDLSGAYKKGGVDLVFEIKLKNAPVRLCAAPPAVFQLVHAVRLPHVGQTVQSQAVFQENGFKADLKAPPLILMAAGTLPEFIGSGRSHPCRLILSGQQKLELV